MADAYDPLQVNLPYFDGPLDLLLHLVRRQQLDINEVRLSELTEPYLAYVEQMSALNLDQAGEFLSIAATLIWIKSRSLLPSQGDEEEELDPETLEEMLLLRLREYQRYKDAAVELAGRDLLGRDTFPRQAPPEPNQPAETGPVFEEASLYALLEAFRKALERATNLADLHIIPEQQRVEEQVEGLLIMLEERRSLFLDEFFAAAGSREAVILVFLALLEMVRLGAVRMVQSESADAVLCEATDALFDPGQDFRARVLERFKGSSARSDPSGDDSADKTTDAPPTDPSPQG